MTSTQPVMDPTCWTGMSSCGPACSAARPTGGDWDWGVLQQRGVAAWLRLRQASVPKVSPPTPARTAPPVAACTEAELVRLLASMALAVVAPG